MPFKDGRQQPRNQTQGTWTRRQAKTLIVAFAVMVAGSIVSVSLVERASAADQPVVVTVHGVELIAQHTQGTFAGYSTGRLNGSWLATVDHTPLNPNARITGGTFTLTASTQRAQRPLNAHISEGTIAITNPGSNCSNQTYKVSGHLMALNSYRSGTFTLTLTHWRHTLLGTCLSYFATTTGSLTLTK